MELEDEDWIDEGDGRGLGQDDDDDEDEDDEEDGNDGHDRDDDGPPVKRARTRGCRPLPPWLLAAFKAVAAECDQRNAAGLPPLYSINKSFFYLRPSTYFLLQGGLLSPLKMYNPQFFV